MNRFDYVKYDDEATKLQFAFKCEFTELAELIESHCESPRARALALTKLEECYMWVGKALSDDQIKRNGSAPLQEERCDQ